MSKKLTTYEEHIRDEFAGKALNGIFSSAELFDRCTELADEIGLPSAQTIADIAYEVADAMMEARKNVA